MTPEKVPIAMETRKRWSHDVRVVASVQLDTAPKSVLTVSSFWEMLAKPPPLQVPLEW